MNAVTSNSTDERNPSLKDLCDTVARRDEPRLKAVRISKATLLNLPTVPWAQASLARLYGVPVQIDNSLELFDVVPVYKENTA